MRVGRAVGRAATGMTCAHQELHVGIAQAPHLNDRRRTVALRHAHQPLSCMPRCLLAGSCQAALAQLRGGRLCRHARAPISQLEGKRRNAGQLQVAAGSGGVGGGRRQLKHPLHSQSCCCGCAALWQPHLPMSQPQDSRHFFTSPMGLPVRSRSSLMSAI